MSDDLTFTGDLAPAFYDNGLEGAYFSSRDDNALIDAILVGGGDPNGMSVVYDNALGASGEGKLSLAFTAAMTLYPECWPGAPQQTGDCVSHAVRSAILGSYANEIMFGVNADKYDAPVVSDQGRKHTVFASEGLYWHRGHSGQGWSCSAAAKCAMTTSAMWLRQDYPQFGFDLTSYSGRNATRWGMVPPPENVVQHGRQNLVKTTTYIRNYQDLRDVIAQGNCVASCGSEAWSGSRDENGVAARKFGTWLHALAHTAVDDRPETIAKYGEGLVLTQNSWGEGYLSGSRKILGTNLEIPGGSFWSRWSDMKNRQLIAFSACKGWPARRLPNWGLGGII